LQPICQLATNIISNAVFKNGEQYFLQSTRIAIGKKCNEAIANLTLCNVEWKHMQTICSNEWHPLNLQAKALGGYQFVMRYVDDSAGRADAMKLLPPAADYKLNLSESIQAQDIVFLGYKWCTTKESQIDLADKQNAIPLELKRYPHAESMMKFSQRTVSLVVCASPPDSA
jgi:hypothetical protein